jgi:hypothetical protein
MRQNIAAEKVKIEEEMYKLLIKHQVDLLKISGATDSQIAKATMIMNAQLGIEQDSLSLLKNKLALEKSITAEKTNQNKYSSESVKLFEIYEKYGARMAVAAQEFLGGKKFDFRSAFGKQLEKILQESFGGRLTQWKMGELKLTSAFRFKEDIVPEINMEDLQLPSITTKIDKITINIKEDLKKILDEKGVSQNIVDSLAEAIKSNPKIKEAIDKRIEDY